MEFCISEIENDKFSAVTMTEQGGQRVDTRAELETSVEQSFEKLSVKNAECKRAKKKTSNKTKCAT